MKIIKEGKNMRAEIKKQTCKKCGCEFEYTPLDVRTDPHPHGGNYVICPNTTCKSFIAV